MDLNKIILVGKLENDPIIRTYGNGKELANLSLSIEEKGANGQTHTTYLRGTTFGYDVAFLKQYCHKGDILLVEGRVENSEYEKDGVKNRSTNFLTEHVYKFNGAVEQKNLMLISGNLVVDPVDYTKDDVTRLGLNVACNRMKRRNEDKEKTDFFRVFATDQLLESKNAKQILSSAKKGTKVLVQGPLHVSTSESNGIKYRNYTIFANQIIYCERTEEAKPATAPQSNSNDVLPDDFTSENLDITEDSLPF